MEIFCFFMGILYLYTANHLILTIALLVFFLSPRYSLILFLLLGFMVAGVHQHFVLPKGMPDNPVLPKAVIQGRIASIPHQELAKTQFVFELEQYNHHPAQGLIQLSWYQVFSKQPAKKINNPPAFHVGERWHLTVKLKKPRNYQNPGSTDFVSSLIARHIHWTGYVLSQTKMNHLESKPPTGFNWLRFREHLGNRLTELAPDQATAGITEALTLNLTRHITQDAWNLFRRTGTTHLFGISGEHIALISGLIFWLIRCLWSKSARCCLYFPAPYVASICALLAAVFYAFLAGFEPPVQRALIGCFLYTLYKLGKIQFTAWQVWRYALFGVLCIEPHAVLMQGFYFSFLAVATLLLIHQRFRLTGYKGNLALQLGCLISLMPLTLYWYAYGSINGFIANLFAIPLVSFLIVPLALVIMMLSNCNVAAYLMSVLSLLIKLLFKGLSWVEQLESININYPMQHIELVIVLMAALFLWVLLPIKPLQWITSLWVLLSFFPPKAHLSSGEALVDVLDVGQGLAVLVRTQNHVLIYDTGDRFFQGSDLGKMVILPYLNTLRIKKIDAVVISHPDKDHDGGLNSLEKETQVNQLLVSEPESYDHGIQCQSFPPWSWDQVNFRFLAIKTHFKEKNNNSCILQISTKAGTILLTGDIEKIAEDYLVRTYGSNLNSEVLVVPHHGSKTSSSYRFLLEVAPKYAIASLGFDNRFHFPHTKTLSNMNSLKIPFYRTDDCGMVQISLPAQGKIDKPICFNGHPPSSIV